MSERRIALFRAGKQEVALWVETVLRIFPTPSVYRLPLMPGGFSGIFIDQEEVFPLLNSSRLSLHTTAAQSDGYIVLCSTDLGAVGLEMDQVLGVVAAEQGEIALTEEERGASGMTSVHFNHAGTSYRLLDIERIVAALPNR